MSATMPKWTKDNQSEVKEFIKSKLGSDVELVTTHASIIFLAGDGALKLKRAVRYPYLDLSTPRKRPSCCLGELELNRRTAQTLAAPDVTSIAGTKSSRSPQRSRLCRRTLVSKVVIAPGAFVDFDQVKRVANDPIVAIGSDGPAQEKLAMYSRILIATDGSDFSARAVEHGARLAGAVGAKLTILTVTEPFHVFSLEVDQLENTRPEYERHMAERGQGILASAARVATAAGADPEIMYRSGSSPYAVILKVAGEKDNDLIVLGSHGRSGVAALLLGSVTMKVLANTTKPVLVVR
jgi:nucleotide-binding universal stress UspA family protein